RRATRATRAAARRSRTAVATRAGRRHRAAAAATGDAHRATVAREPATPGRGAALAGGELAAATRVTDADEARLVRTAAGPRLAHAGRRKPARDAGSRIR